MVITTSDVEKMRQEQREDIKKLRALKKQVSNLNLHSSEEEIILVLNELSLARVNNGSWHLEYDEAHTNYVFQLLNLKQQEKLVKEQKQGNKDLVASTKSLVYATIALVIFTAVLSLEPLLRG